MNPIDTSNLTTAVGQVGPLFAFMMFIIICLGCFVMYLMRDSRAERKENADVMSAISTTLAGIKELINVLITKS